jgi:hypothetical protein
MVTLPDGRTYVVYFTGNQAESTYPNLPMDNSGAGIINGSEQEWLEGFFLPLKTDETFVTPREQQEQEEQTTCAWSVGTLEELDRIHNKVSPLLEILARLNNRQGLEYKLLGRLWTSGR